MKKTTPKSRRQPDDMLPEYDFSKGVRGRYAGRFPKDCLMVVLDPDVAQAFPSAKQVNDVLRAFVDVARRTKKSA